MEEWLLRAAIKGDELGQILSEDKLILDKIQAGCFKINPLHLAISRGQARFLGALIEANRDICFARDPDGRNPVHVAAMTGNVDALTLLVLKSPIAARVKLERDETILHLCVKHRQLESLKLLLRTSIGFDFLNARDSGGNTILHLAVSDKNFDIVKHIVNYDNHINDLHHKREGLEVNVMNAEGHTALDIAHSLNNGDLQHFLKRAKCMRAKDMLGHDWLSKKRETLMVVASLIATMAFQAAVSPPAGVWQDDLNGHTAGEAVMAYNYPDSYPYFLRANTIAFVASLSTIMLLIRVVPFKNRLYVWRLVVIIWLTITSTAITFGFSITVVTPKKYRGSLIKTIMMGVIVWCGTTALLLVYRAYEFIKRALSDCKIENEFKNNITLYGYGDQDRTIDNSAQTTEIQMANRDVNGRFKICC